MDRPLATVEHANCKAEVYETELPGQFSVRYLNGKGQVAAEEPLTGVSSYRQREQEIRDRIDELCRGGQLDPTPLSDSGEY